MSGRVAIIGAGVAGLMTALRLAPQPVVLLSKAPLGDNAASAWAQGGLAASLGADDSPALHLEDTLAAGDGLCDEGVVADFVRAAPAAIEALARLGVRFDRTSEGAFRLGLEAAHRRRRIVHAAGDGTGREVMRALVEAVRRTPSIEILEGFEARRLLVDDNSARGVVAVGAAATVAVETDRIVIATGGIGGLFLESTNPPGSFGQGLALAARAGAALANLEFIQFHPTAFDGPARPMPLISEAVRGEGAILIDETGRRFLADQPGAELAARDVVARAIWRHIGEGHRVFLDARAALGRHFAQRFPAIAAACRAAGVDPATMPIPVRPAAHYHMGGVAVDANGRSTVDGLWACGEAACTGLHGA
ncbi:MAG: L-aspartate oxidase, partial [Pseudomonadota bacterium]|nr:L-aspartate oxidase [Pseudomonadota bacterium]